jgi:hypothetical protein
MNDKNKLIHESPKFEHKNCCALLNKLGWEHEQAKILASHAQIDYSPGDPFLPAEFSFDTVSRKIGVFYSTNSLNPSAPVLQSICSWLSLASHSDSPLNLLEFLIEAYDGLMGKKTIRFGYGVKKDTRTVYFEGIPAFALSRLSKCIGAEESYPSIEKSLLKMGQHMLPEGVGISIAGAAKGTLKIYIPVRNSDPEKFYQCISDICGAEWGGALRDTLQLIVGFRDIFQSGRLILGLTSGDTRLGMTIYLENLLPSDACTLSLAHFAGNRLGTNTELLNRVALDLAPAFKWTKTSAIAFLNVEPGRKGHPRLRLWLRPVAKKMHNSNETTVNFLLPSIHITDTSFKHHIKKSSSERIDQITVSIDRAIHFLYERQLPSGEFITYSSTNKEMRKDCRSDSTIFATVATLLSLRFIKNSKVAKMIDRSLSFLKGEMQHGGFWKYWASETCKEISSDLDDTACASFLLMTLDKQPMYQLNADSILRNRNPEGLFYTWLHTEDEPNDIDSVVNANALLYLGERQETLTVCQYLNNLVLRAKEPESYYYYLDVLFFYYALSRAYLSGASQLKLSRDSVLDKVLHMQQGDGSFGNILSTSLAICTILNLTSDHQDVLDRAINCLLENQCSNGSWIKVAAWAGPPPPGPHSVWWGSEEFTTANCLEALVRYSGYFFNLDRHSN